MDLTELEQDFRRTWRDFEPQRYAQFLGRASQDQRSELLARLLSVELEFVYQPPASSEAEQQSCIDNSNDDESDDDDRRVTPCVQLFLLRFPELAHKPDLIIRLIVLEYALRLRHDRLPPNPESYLPLCEENQERLIKLLELTERKLPLQRSDTFDAEPVKHSDSTVKESQVSQAIAIDPLPLNLGCFLLLRLLGRGGMGYVHAAIDLRSTAQVAVKVMRRVDAWSIYRFIEEFSWLSQLSHPNLVKLYDAFCDGHIRYFSMELVEGTTIRQWFKQLPGAADHRWNELRRVLTQLASAVNYLHERGVLHCDIKCSNMMISAGHRAVLLDLGLAVRAGDENRMVGTLQYMAPEVLGGSAPTSASDWHSFGVMIFEVVTDSFPPVQIDLSSDNSSDQKYRMDHEKLEQGLATCPEDLAKLCMDLLSIPPEQRPLGSEILGRLGDPGASLGHFSTQPECTGREWELQRIDAAVRPLPGQAASLVVVQGESGSGKTTLVQCWMKHLRPSHSLLLSLCCYQQDHTPVRLLNMLVQELVPSLARLPASHWRPSLKARFKEIRILFPQVQQLLSNDVLPSLVSKGHDGLLATPETSRQVSIQALLEWLIELSHGQRLVLCIDDVQWADNESLRGLRRLLCHERKFQGAVLVVDESEESRVLDLLVRDESSADSEPPPFHCSLVPLQPLSEDTCLLLLGRWAQRAQVAISPSVLQDIAVRGSGNPFLLLELFRAYVHHARWGSAADNDWLLADSQSNVRRRFSLLSIEAENVLQYLAVADQGLSFHQLQMVSRIVPDELQRTLSYLTSQGWIRAREYELEANVEVAHENFRRAIVQAMPVERLHRRHYRLARILSSETPPPWARIAGHYWSAEHFREAATCYLEAARAAVAASAMEEALEFLQRASHVDAQRTPREQYQVQELKAHCLARQGSSHAAAELYAQLMDNPQDAEHARLVQCLCGEQWIRAGQLDPALAELKLALKPLGVGSGRRTWLSHWWLRWRTLRVGWAAPRQRLPGPDRHASNSAFSETEKCLNRIATPLTFLDNQLGPDLVLRMNTQAEDHGSDFDSALALLRTGVLLCFVGRRWHGQVLRRFRLARRLARECRSAEARATGGLCLYIWSIQRGRIRHALRYAQAALKQYECSPGSTQWEQQFLQWASLRCYWFSNQLRTLQQSTARLRASAISRHDPMAMFLTHVSAAHWSDLVADDTQSARAALSIAGEAIASQSYESPRFFLWLSRVYQALYENEAQCALDTLRQDWQRLDKSLVMSTNHYRWLALSTRCCADLLALRNGLPQQTHYRRDARWCVRRLVRLEEGPFVAAGQAFSLVIEAQAGRVAPLASWRTTIAQLHTLGHHLLAFALQWHLALYTPTEEAVALRQQTLDALGNEGCVAPAKLLNVVLPLPSQSGDGHRGGCPTGHSSIA